MTAILPIIKKNFIYSKRNFFRTLLQLFYPCIILWIIIYMYESGNDTPIEERTYYEFSYDIDTKEKYYFEEISSTLSEFSYAIIGKEDSYRNKISSILTQELGKI